jgi:hypothetical protein
LGFPIRISPDHSLLAASRGFSQLIASFFAYLRQGIHTHALSSLTIKSTSHTTHSPIPAEPFLLPAFRAVNATFTLSARRPHSSPYCTRDKPGTSDHPAIHLAADCRVHKLVFCLCPSIFNCQRSRLPQQSVELWLNELLEQKLQHPGEQHNCFRTPSGESRSGLINPDLSLP